MEEVVGRLGGVGMFLQSCHCPRVEFVVSSFLSFDSGAYYSPRRFLLSLI